jgi:hypothetical protein
VTIYNPAVFYINLVVSLKGYKWVGINGVSFNKAVIVNDCRVFFLLKAEV